MSNYDFINPPHYKTADGRETWDRMEDKYGTEATAIWCEMTAFKYQDCRIHNQKPGEDKQREEAKIKRYLDKAKELRNKIKTMQIKVTNTSKHELPKYQTLLSAGCDLRANLEAPVTLKPLQRALIPTGLYIELKAGLEAQIRPRSGMAYKHGVTVLNSPGTVDSDFRGEVKVLLVNLSDAEFTVEDGERIAQMVIAKHETVSWVEDVELEVTERGAGGFGSTGRA